MMLFSDNEKNKMLNDLNKIIKKTYMAETKSPKIDNQFINMEEVLDYYKRKYNVDFQKSTLESLSDSSYDKLLNELEPDRDDDKQKDEGKDIQNEEIEKTVQEQIDKSKMPSNTLDKEGIMKELSEMAEDEKDISEKDINSFVKAATIKAIYKATLEKYEQNRKEINKHADIVLNRDGDFALEDRLARENLMYEVYLNKLSKQYASIVPNHKEIDTDKKIASAKERIKYNHNKREEERENRREKIITSIVLLQNERNKITKDMVNPEQFSEARYQELQERLAQIDAEINQLKPEVIIEGDKRDTRQEEIAKRELGSSRGTPNASVAKTSKENEKKEENNSDKIIESTNDTLKNDKSVEEELIDKYYSCISEGDYNGAKECYQRLMTVHGSKENLENNIEDMNNDGKKEYETKSEEEDTFRKDLNLDKTNSEEELAEIDTMTENVQRISERNNYEVKREEKNNVNRETSEPKQHTLYGNKRPY